MADGMTAAEAAALYERDFYAWTQEQARALRQAAEGRASPVALDFTHLAEEIEDLGKRERRELASRVATIVEHLTKLRVSPAREPRAGWAATVRREREELRRLLDDNPSLRRDLGTTIAATAPQAVRRAALELQDRGEIDSAMAARLVGADYSPDEVLGDWWPQPLAYPQPQG